MTMPTTKAARVLKINATPIATFPASALPFRAAGGRRTGGGQAAAGGRDG
jgi:hypothetical protein